MITKNELREYCTITGFTLWQVERDYLQHLALIFLSKKSTNTLVFKGGTALQKAYGLNRFSIDLDFTQLKENNLKELLEYAAKGISDFGYSAKVEEIQTLGRTFIIKIHGPLFTNTPVTACNVRVEISQRENILLKPVFKEITPVYRDLQSYTLLVMHPEEILAEKIRAIMTRNKPRDIFDLHFLLKKDVKFNLAFINTKLGYYKETFDQKRFIEKLQEKKPIWEKEIRNYIAQVPDFDVIFKAILEKIK